MKAEEFEKRLNEITQSVSSRFGGITLEPVNDWFGKHVDAETYSATSEYYMERQLVDLGKGKRKTAFMSDISHAECFGLGALLGTFRNASMSWCDDVEYVAEFILCLNWKAWEHDARKKNKWATVYSLLFEDFRDLMYDYYEGDDKKTEYLWHYLD